MPREWLPLPRKFNIWASFWLFFCLGLKFSKKFKSVSRTRVWITTGPRSVMDNAFDFESKDCGFESHRGQFFFSALNNYKKKKFQKNAKLSSFFMFSARFTCQTGYTGSNCGLEINECLSNPCPTGVHCSDLLASYRCNCPTGKTGANCDSDVDECQSAPCNPYDGEVECVNLHAAYKCECPSYLVGPQCQVYNGKCDEAPCKHGSCIDFNVEKRYKCDCLPGWEGYNCDVEVAPACDSMPCRNGGECLKDYRVVLLESRVLGKNQVFGLKKGFSRRFSDKNGPF